MKSSKQKIKELGEILERHRRKTLPKSYYAKDGKLYPHVLLYKERKSVSEKRDRDKDLIAREKAIPKLREQIKRAYENSRISRSGKGRSRKIFI